MPKAKIEAKPPKFNVLLLKIVLEENVNIKKKKKTNT